MIPFQRTPPPPQKKKKTTYHLGGGPEYHFHEKNHFFIFLPFFACFTMSSSEAVSGQMKMDFKNPREVFSQNGMKNKNLSHFLQRAMSRENRSHLRGPFFQISSFLLQSRSCRSCYGQLGTNLVKPKEVFVQNMSISNNLLHFFTQVSSLKRKTRLFGPLFRRKPVRLSWQTRPKFRQNE
jgi:hypothetical protein